MWETAWVWLLWKLSVFVKWKIFIGVERSSALKRVVKQLTPKLAEGSEKIADHLSEGGVIPRRGLCPQNHIGWNCCGLLYKLTTCICSRVYKDMFPGVKFLFSAGTVGWS